MKLKIIAGLLCLLPAPALAQSSIAIGLPDDIAQYGMAFGVTSDAGSRAIADSQALQGCRTAKDTEEESRALCRTVANFDNRCVAFAYDPEPGTWGFGWAVFDTQAGADRLALSNCRTAARERRAYCKVVLRQCDGSAI